MKIGVPKEVKNNENRVAITPAGVTALVNVGMMYILKHRQEKALDSMMKITQMQELLS